MDNIILGDARKVLDEVPTWSCHCCVTSPPYFGQRDYKVNGQIGREKSPDLYLDNLIEVFLKIERVLRDDGTLWINIGDVYSDGELLGLPWQLAFRLQRIGFSLRQEIIWHKPAPMTGEHPGRCVPSHEHLFLFSKKDQDYYFDKEAIKEVNEDGEQRHMRDVWTLSNKGYKGAHFATFPLKLVERCLLAGCPAKVCLACCEPHQRQIFSERVPTRPGTKTKATERSRVQGNRDPRRHITRSRTTGWKPGCECSQVAGVVGGLVIDPFFGAGTVGVVAKKLGRQYLGVEVNSDYILMARERIAKGGSKGFGLLGE